MAKRKRLTPATGIFGDSPDDAAPSATRPSEPRLSQPGRSGPPPIAGIAGDAQATAALQELADTLSSARAEGRMVLRVPLDQIALDHLVRDRAGSGTDEMDALVASIRARGQQTPIDLMDMPGGGYGLISGWRRCEALRRLFDETRDPRFASALALVRHPADASGAYVAMIEENEIRAGLSYYERARIVLRTTEGGVFEDTKTALQTLFQAASRPRRSKIGSFTTVVAALDGYLTFPHTIGERLGLKLAKALSEDAGLAARLRAALLRAVPQTPEAEQALIEKALKGRGASRPPARVVPGRVRLTVEGQGRVSLTGVTPALHNALLDWLKKNTGGVDV